MPGAAAPSAQQVLLTDVKPIYYIPICPRRVRAAGTTYRYKTDVLYPDILMLTRGARRLGLAARTRLPSGGCWITVAVTRLSCAATVTLLAGALLTAAAA